MIVAVVKFNTLKCAIIDAYNKVIQKMNRGYPLENIYEISEAIKTIKFMSDNDCSDDEIKTIVNHFLTKL